jgi:hypothetical protein
MKLFYLVILFNISTSCFCATSEQVRKSPTFESLRREIPPALWRSWFLMTKEQTYDEMKAKDNAYKLSKEQQDRMESNFRKTVELRLEQEQKLIKVDVQLECSQIDQGGLDWYFNRYVLPAKEELEAGTFSLKFAYQIYSNWKQAIEASNRSNKERLLKKLQHCVDVFKSSNFLEALSSLNEDSDLKALGLTLPEWKGPLPSFLILFDFYSDLEEVAISQVDITSLPVNEFGKRLKRRLDTLKEDYLDYLTNHEKEVAEKDVATRKRQGTAEKANLEKKIKELTEELDLQEQRLNEIAKKIPAIAQEAHWLGMLWLLKHSTTSL